VLAVLAGAGATAQGPALVENGRALGPVVATSPIRFMRIMGVRELTDGRLMAHDPQARVVILLDANLHQLRIVIDSAPGLPISYGSFPGAMIPYPGDTTIFADARAGVFEFLDPDGRIARVAASPPSLPVMTFLSGVGVRASGDIVYRLMPRIPVGPIISLPVIEDYAFVVASDPRARTLDTVGTIRIPARVLGTRRPGATILPRTDDWVVMTDGSVAFIRGSDYHIDWVSPSGRRTSSAPVAHRWRELSNADRHRMADSITRVRDSIVSQLPPGSRASFDAFGMLVGSTTVPIGSDVPPPPIRLPPPISPEVIPDSLAAFVAGTAVADGMNRLWIMVREGGPQVDAVYDVVDRKGALVDQVRIPPGHSIAGFGAGDVIYLAAEGRTRLLKVRVR
jgi:hypothetical protein